MNAVKTILFVENDPVGLQMYSNRLEREGFHIDSAHDGLEALKRISQATPDLVILDMALPKLDGGDVLRFIRADPRLKQLPAVIFSNTPLNSSDLALEVTEMTQHLLKCDCTFPVLLQTIRDLLAPAPDDASLVISIPDTCCAAPPEGNTEPAPDAALPAGPAGKCGQFIKEAQAEIPRIREHCFAYMKAPASPTSLQHLPGLYQRVHFLSTNADPSGCARVAMLTKAFDTLLSEIMIKPAWVTPSVLQTLAQAVDCLDLLLRCDEDELEQPSPPAKVLVVDDDAVCNHVIVGTLKGAGFEPNSVNDPLVALHLLQSNHFDLVLLDINMPDLSGFEVCTQLRRFPHCRNVPVIFITSHNNFDNRNESVLSGGHDFLAKPVSAPELALKATIHLLKASVQPPAAAPQALIPPPEEAPPDAGDLPSSTTPEALEIRISGVLASEELIPMTESGNSEAATTSSAARPSLFHESASAPVTEEPLVRPDVEPVGRMEFHSAKNSKPSGPIIPQLQAAAGEKENQDASGETVSSIDPSPAMPIKNAPEKEKPVAAETAAPAVSQTAEPMPEQLVPTTASPGPAGQRTEDKFEQVVTIVAQIMFGERSSTERNLRLVRAALERYQVPEIIDSPAIPPREISGNGSH